MDAAAEYFCGSWDFGVAAKAVPAALSDEYASVVAVIVTVSLEVGVVVMVTVVLYIGFRDAMGEIMVVGREVLVVCFLL